MVSSRQYKEEIWKNEVDWDCGKKKKKNKQAYNDWNQKDPRTMEMNIKYLN